MELLDFNEDCLINLCKFLDAESIVAFSETCRRLNNVASNFFQHKKSYTCCIGSVENEAIAARTLRKVGKYLTRIDLMFELKYSSTSYHQLFTLLTESVDEHLIEFSILGEICCMPLNILAPVFLQLQTLTLQNLCWDTLCFSRIDLPLLCPNLRKLTASGQIFFAPGNMKALPSMESLDVDFALPLVLFFPQNRQLKKLNLRNRRTVNQIQLDSFNEQLVNLQELHLDIKLIKNPIDELPGLAAMQNLHALQLYSIPAKLFNDILKILETLVGLKEIVLQAYLTRLDAQFSSIQESLVRLAFMLTELESFVTVSIDWTSETVADFVSQAKKLISLDFWSGSDSNYIVTPKFIRRLATIRKLSVNAQMQPLQLKMYSMDCDLKEVFREPKVADYIQLSK